MSPPVTVDIPHQLGRAEARRRLETGFGQLIGQLGAAGGAVRQEWTGDRLVFSVSAVGQSITGFMDVGDQSVRLEVTLPGMLGMLADRMKGRIRRQGQILLEHRKP